MTHGYFQRWNYHWKDKDLMIFLQFKKIRCKKSRLFQKSNIWNVSNSGKMVRAARGVNENYSEGCTQQKTKIIFHNYYTSDRYFRSDLVLPLKYHSTNLNIKFFAIQFHFKLSDFSNPVLPNASYKQKTLM